MHYFCKFQLRNLTSETQTVQVGFPLMTSYVKSRPKGKNSQNPAPNSLAMQVRYSFFAGSQNEAYPVRFVEEDEQQKFRDLFLWEMTFQPNEELELNVSYEMRGYLGLADVMNFFDDSAKKIPAPLRVLSGGIGQSFNYVTETGNCWAGKIEKASFEIRNLDSFERWLDLRGAMEDLPKVTVSADGEAAAPPSHDFLNPFGARFCQLNPPRSEWTEVKGESGCVTGLKLNREPFKAGETLSIAWVFTNFPKTPADFQALRHFLNDQDEILKNYADWLKANDPEADDRLLQALKDRAQKACPLTPEEERLLAGLILEFYGLPTHAPSVEELLPAYRWHPVQNPQKIDPKLKKISKKPK